MNQKKEISDLALCAYLSTLGYKLTSTPTNSYGNRTIFIFEASQKMETDILNFYNRTARIDPLAFIETFRNLKALTR
jgi:hypothetical protein